MEAWAQVFLFQWAGGFYCLFTVLKTYVYLFGYVSSWLRPTMSSLGRVGSCIEAHGLSSGGVQTQ